jgi:hypothetical protein
MTKDVNPPSLTRPPTASLIDLSSTNLLGLIEREGVTALTARVTIIMDGHESRSTAVGGSALTSQAGDLVVLID